MGNRSLFGKDRRRRVLERNDVDFYRQRRELAKIAHAAGEDHEAALPLEILGLTWAFGQGQVRRYATLAKPNDFGRRVIEVLEETGQLAEEPYVRGFLKKVMTHNAHDAWIEWKKRRAHTKPPLRMSIPHHPPHAPHKHAHPEHAPVQYGLRHPKLKLKQ